jgi:hypothetical protein
MRKLREYISFVVDFMNFIQLLNMIMLNKINEAYLLNTAFLNNFYGIYFLARYVKSAPNSSISSLTYLVHHFEVLKLFKRLVRALVCWSFTLNWKWIY